MSDPCTCAECNAKQNRIHAFGAMRRATEIARRYDNAEREMAARNYYEAAGVYGRYAENIRRAIRAAIGGAS